MIFLDPREPMSAWSHTLGLILAVVVTRFFWRKCIEKVRPRDAGADSSSATDLIYERGKFVAILIFGFSLMICYGTSALYHAVRATGEPLYRLRRLDHVGIYLLIAGTYTPAAWSLFKGAWRRRTLTTVWALAAVCSLRVWLGGVLPTWVSTIIYLSMGWGVILCYGELVRELGHRTLLPLPLGGVFYSLGAVINLAGWPVLLPGYMGAHDLFHVFVVAGSACHVIFMLRTVVPATQPAGWLDPAPEVVPSPSHLAGRLSIWGFRLFPQPGGLLFRPPHMGTSAAAFTEREHSAEPAAIIPRAQA